MRAFGELGAGLRHRAATVAAALAATLLVAGGPSVAQAPSPGNVTITVFPGGLVSPSTSIMINTGLLAKHGVDAKLMTILSAPGIVALLVSGFINQADIAPSLSSPLVKQGECFKCPTGGLGSVAERVDRPFCKRPNLSKGFQEPIKHLKSATISVVALASGMQIPGEVLLMDGPVAALDAQTKIEVRAVFLNIREEQSQSVGFVTRDPNDALLLGDRIVMPAAGGEVVNLQVPFRHPRDVAELPLTREFRDLERKLSQTLG